MAVDQPERSEEKIYPIYSSTFTIHRLSPLYHGTSLLTNSLLSKYASTFRNLLAGEVLRGVRVGLAIDDDTLARVGGLQTVRWTFLRSEDHWIADTTEPLLDETDGIGMLVEVIYEKANYSAIFVRDTGFKNERGFSHLPLVLTRMPGHLRETLLDFIANTFDSRYSVVKLSSNTLTSMLEEYLKNVTSDEDGQLSPVQADLALRTLVRDIQLTISFNMPSESGTLKSLDITIPGDDIWGMVSRGRRLEGISAGNGSRQFGPFMKAIRLYLRANLAFDADHDQVEVSRISSSAFLAASEGKLKILAPQKGSDINTSQHKAIYALLDNLVALARGPTFA